MSIPPPSRVDPSAPAPAPARPSRGRRLLGGLAVVAGLLGVGLWTSGPVAADGPVECLTDDPLLYGDLQLFELEELMAADPAAAVQQVYDDLDQRGYTDGTWIGSVTYTPDGPPDTSGGTYLAQGRTRIEIYPPAFQSATWLVDTVLHEIRHAWQINQGRHSPRDAPKAAEVDAYLYTIERAGLTGVSVDEILQRWDNMVEFRDSYLDGIFEARIHPAMAFTMEAYFEAERNGTVTQPFACLPPE